MGWKVHCRACGADFVAVKRCHHRLCPDCAPIRGLRLFEAHKRMLGRPNLKHLVLTFKNVEHLTPEYIDYMNNCFSKFRRRKILRRSWRGGVKAFEITYSKQTGFHPHIHALVDGGYVPQDVLSKMWLDITGDSSVVWISRAKKSKQILKYILKPGEDIWDNTEALRELLIAIESRHFVSGWGKHYRVTEKFLLPEQVCPYCGSTALDLGDEVLWSDYWGRWVLRSPP